jgi:hypothetical protein
MKEAIKGHVSSKLLEEYSLDSLTKRCDSAVEEHLLVCVYCCTRLEAVEPLSFVHITEDGPIYSRATRLTTGFVIARQWGKELDGMRMCGSIAHAQKYLNKSFSEMFPEHSCDSRCGGVQERGNYLRPERQTDNNRAFFSHFMHRLSD